MITIKQFENAARATLDNDIKRALMVLGPTGIGKSEVIHQIARACRMAVIDLRLLLWSLTDLKGIPYPDKTRTYTRWLINDVLPRVPRDGSSGILLLEELNAAPKAVQAAAYQLTLDRKIGDYTLPDGWFIIATGNREQDNGVYTPPPAPLADRFEIHEVDIDFTTWRNHAIKTGCHPHVTGYLSANPKAIYTFKPDDTAELIFATPRSWMAVSDLLNADFPHDILEIKINGNIGAAEGTAFRKYRENATQLPRIEDILNGNSLKMAATYTAPLDIYYLILQNLIYTIAAAHQKNNGTWPPFVRNSIDFICTIPHFPLELKKSYIDQLCELGKAVRQYLYAETRNQHLSKLLQELDYIT